MQRVQQSIRSTAEISFRTLRLLFLAVMFMTTRFTMDLKFHSPANIGSSLVRILTYLYMIMSRPLSFFPIPHLDSSVFLQLLHIHMLHPSFRISQTFYTMSYYLGIPIASHCKSLLKGITALSELEDHLSQFGVDPTLASNLVHGGWTIQTLQL